MLTHEEMTEYLFLENFIPQLKKDIKDHREVGGEYSLEAKMLLTCHARKRELARKFCGLGD